MAIRIRHSHTVRVLPLLDKKYRILATDHRGHGDSDTPETGYDMRDFAVGTAAFLDDLGRA